MPDLEKLDAYLVSDDAHPDSMGLSDLDGFLTGIACSPEEVPEEEWLNHALGSAEETPGAIVELVHDMLGDIIERLVHSGPLDPLFWEKQDGTVIAMDWCEGFMDAVKMRPERWDAFAQTDGGSKLMLPILVHMIDDNGKSEFGIPPEDLDETLAAAAEAIPTVVPAIYQRIRMVTRN
jgi:uncharacterized protein